MRQQIRPAVEKYLAKERQLEFAPVNKGALVVTFKEYSGKQPCFGHYYCDKCNTAWTDRGSWVGMWQACYNCDKRTHIRNECYPLKQRPLKKSPSSHARSAKQGGISHLQELCEKCIQLKRPCA